MKDDNALITIDQIVGTAFGTVTTNYPNMVQQDRLWTLMSRKLSGEATMNELEELLDMLDKDPGVYYSMKVISDLWKRVGATSQAELESAYKNHLKRAELHFSHN